MKYFFRITAVFFLFGFAFVACSSDSTLNLDGFDSKAADLIGSQWELISFRSDEGKNLTIPADAAYTLRFETSNELSGRAADCNPYFAPYQARDGGVLSVGRVSSSFVLCAVASPMTAYFEAIGSASSYATAEDQLRLGFGDRGVLTYRKAAGSME